MTSAFDDGSEPARPFEGADPIENDEMEVTTLTKNRDSVVNLAGGV